MTRSAAHFVILPALGLVVAACSSVPSGFTEACDGDVLALAAGFSPNGAVDFVGEQVETLRQNPTTFAYVLESRTFGSDQRGTACSGAKDRAACLAKIAAIPAGTSCNGFGGGSGVRTRVAAPPSGETCTRAYYVYTRGDEVGVVSNFTEARAFFAAIDTPQEAIALARFNGETFTCDDSPAGYAARADGFEVAAKGPCGHRVLVVSRDGKVDLDRDDCKEDP